jgi:hypothetical protein
LDRAHAGNGRYVLYGHLKPGLGPTAAEAEVRAVVKRVAQDYPGLYPRDFYVTIQPLGVYTIGRFKPMLYLLLGSVSRSF